MSIKPTNIPKCHLRKSADSAGNISRHCKLGELTENIRTFALPFESQTYTFKMQYKYDSWNRIQTMIYPDGEVVRYDYNLGGLINNISPYPPGPYDSLNQRNSNVFDEQASPDGSSSPQGIVPGYTTYTYPYIDSITYNEFELKSEMFYGNGAHTQYDYDSIQRLRDLQSRTRAGGDMQHITYSYDAVSDITRIVNVAGPFSDGLGGTYSHDYQYDDLYRLIYSSGQWDNAIKNEHLKDTLRMAYHKNGRIASKKSYADVYSEGGYGAVHTTQNSKRAYNYNTLRPNTLASVYDSANNMFQNFSWTNTGNMRMHNNRSLTWTEDNRLQTVMDNEWFSYYQYDAAGERTYKLPCFKTHSNRSGSRSVYWAPAHTTLYASPYLVVTPRGYTKHYYAESERITSQIGRGNFSTLTSPVTDTATANRKVRRADSLVLALNPRITDTAAQLTYLTALTNRQKDTCEAYWYHTDHLGSSSWITDSAGNAVQHLHYLPWGEDYVNQRTGTFSSMYTFSAKEKDTETGYSYFGSRYYSSDLSIWLSVDPMAGKYPYLSPYTYCANNPVKLVDPNGEEIGGPDNPPTKYTIKKGDTFWDLENARNLPHGTIQKDNPTVDPNNLQVGQVIYYPYLLGNLIVHDDEIAVNSNIPDYFYQPTSFGITMNLENYKMLSPFLSLYNLGESFHNLSSFSYFLKTNLFNRKFGFRTPALLLRLRPLGKGHTGRFTPENLTEDLAMKHIQGNPQMGKVILRKLHDPRWEGWSKMTWTNESKTIEIHYNAKFNSYDRIISIDDFKFKRP